MSTKEKLDRRVLLRHIKRLQEQNRLLADVIADERRLRQAAWTECWYRLNARFLGALFSFLDLFEGEQRAQQRFESDVATRCRRLA